MKYLRYLTAFALIFSITVSGTDNSFADETKKKGKPKTIKLKWTKKDKPEKIEDGKFELYGHENIAPKQGVRFTADCRKYGVITREMDCDFKYTAGGINKKRDAKLTVYYGDKKLYSSIIKKYPWQVKVERKKNKITITHLSKKTKIELEEDNSSGKIKIEVTISTRWSDDKDSYLESLELKYKGYKDEI